MSQIDGTLPISGKEDLDEIIKAGIDALGTQFKGNPHIALICRNHAGQGLHVVYEDGVLVLRCVACNNAVCQIAVAQKGSGIITVGGVN